jgi:hypothetical protein
MKIDITTQALDRNTPPIQLHLNGRLAAEIFLGKVEQTDDLEARCIQANVGTTLLRVAKEHRPQWEAASKNDRAAFLRGLADGFAGDHEVPHPQNAGFSKMPKEAPVEYEAGSSLARFLIRCVAVAYPPVPQPPTV